MTRNLLAPYLLVTATFALPAALFAIILAAGAADGQLARVVLAVLALLFAGAAAATAVAAGWRVLLVRVERKLTVSR